MDPRATPADLLESVLARAIELRDEGCADWVELACKDCPELADRVREAAQGTELMARWFVDPFTADSTPGRTLAGRFRLGKRAGAGAMGVVYRAEDLELVRPVAVKILRAGLMDPEESRHRFAREAAAMASVQHASVVTIHDRGQTGEGEHFIVMEWLDGAPLGDIVEEAARKSESARVEDTQWLRKSFGIGARGEASWLRTAVRWTAELATGLGLVHAAGVLHRDIKPSNVIVRKDGTPVLLDFGIALLEGDSSLTRGATSVGTPSYMPPEALTRGRRRTPASDVYSLCATLYHLVTLRPPYQGTPSEVLAAIATREPVPAVRHAPGLPRDLQAILEMGMSRNPRGRYASAAALEADLRAFLAHRPVVARPVTAWTRAWRALRRSKAAQGAAATLALVILALAALEVRSVQAAQRQARVFELVRHFPPNFTVLGRTNRVYRYEADRAHVQALLDEAADVGADALRVHLLRSSFRLDHGDPAGAASDMAAVAQEAGTGYSRELAKRYAAVAPAARGHGALDLRELPEPGAATDRYLAGYHALRAGQELAGHELLSDPEVRRIPHAQELWLASTYFDRTTSEGQHERALQGYSDTIRLEQQLGGRTAATANIAAGMLIVMNRYEQAFAVASEGIALAERAHTLRINAGFAAYGLGRFEDARRHLEVARDLRPNYRKVLHDLVCVLVEQQEFDEALKLIDEAPLDEVQSTAPWRLIEKASVETRRALGERSRGALEESKASVQRALGHWTAAEELAGDLIAAERVGGDLHRPVDLAILQGLADGNDLEIFTALASVLKKDPDHSWQARSLLLNMPKDLDVEATQALRGVLEALVERLTSRNLEPAPAASPGR